MILKSYTFENWGPHQKGEIIFPTESRTIALCGENDQGKSWIVRGIAFTLSIGRNEYGDQSSIHAGQESNQAYHKLVVEANGKSHTIEKIVKNKLSKDEGTTTLINGQETDRLGFEEFYANELGLPHPYIWLPLVVSMQNETDQHLRSKKSLREQALRTLCQLDRIDNWKETLCSKVNSQERETSENLARLQALEKSKQKDCQDIKELQKKFKEELASLKNLKIKTFARNQSPQSPESPESPESLGVEAEHYVTTSIEEIVPKLQEFENLEQALEKSKLESANLKREQNLLKEKVNRITKELDNIQNLQAKNHEQELEYLTQEIHLRNLKRCELSIENLETSQSQVQEQISQLGELPNQKTLEILEPLCSNLRTKLDQHQNQKDLLETLLLSFKLDFLKPDQAQTQRSSDANFVRNLSQTKKILNECISEEKSYESDLKRLTKTLEDSQAQENLLEKKIQSLQTELDQLDRINSQANDLYDITPQSPQSPQSLRPQGDLWAGPPISHHESLCLLARLLAHWETMHGDGSVSNNAKETKSCPVCSQSLSKLKHWDNKELRTATLQELKASIIQNSPDSLQNSRISSDDGANGIVALNLFISSLEKTRKELVVQRRITLDKFLTSANAQLLRDIHTPKNDSPLALTEFLNHLNQKLKEVSKKIQTLGQCHLQLENIQETKNLLQDLVLKINDNLEPHFQIERGSENEVLHLALDKILDWKKKVSKREELQKDWLQYQKETTRLKKEGERLKDILSKTQMGKQGANNTAPYNPFSKLKDQELEDLQITLTQKVKDWRASFRLHLEKEKELSVEKTRLEIVEKNFQQTERKILEADQKLLGGCGIPYVLSEGNYQTTLPQGLPTPSQNPTNTADAWRESVHYWKKREKLFNDLQHKLEPLPAKLASLRAEIAELTENIDSLDKELTKLSEARTLISFLDYKSAPRKLLGSIVEKLFAETNRIAKKLEAEISLKVGKNLDFLTVQQRGGNIVEQKTERLGFGKSAILGICFRLACQKLLLPEANFLILDEPTANVDQKRKAALKSFLQNLGEESQEGGNSQTKQIILIEHDTEVVELCHSKILVQS